MRALYPDCLARATVQDARLHFFTAIKELSIADDCAGADYIDAALANATTVDGSSTNSAPLMSRR